MAVSNDPIFAQTPKTAAVAFAAATQSTQMDPSSVSPETLITAGTNGALVTSIVVHAEETQTAEKHVLWIQLLGAGSWYPVKSVVMAAYTQAATDAQGSVTPINKTNPNEAIRLAATDVLGVTHHVDQQSMVVAEYMDY